MNKGDEGVWGVIKITVQHLYFAGVYFHEFHEFGGICEIFSTNFLRLRPPKGIITRAPPNHTFSVNRISERERVKLRQRVESCQILKIPDESARSRELVGVTACAKAVVQVSK